MKTKNRCEVNFITEIGKWIENRQRMQSKVVISGVSEHTNYEIRERLLTHEFQCY